MSFSLKVKQAATATTNPDPSTLGTVSPFPTPYVDPWHASSAWTTQASSNSSAVVPRGGLDGRGTKCLNLAFNPSGGNGVTYTATIWAYEYTIGKWMKPFDDGVWNLTGNQTVIIENIWPVPYFIQLSNISSGTVDIWTDGQAQLL